MLTRLDDLVHGLQDVLGDVKRGALPLGYGPFAGMSLRFVLELLARLEDGGFADPLWVRTLLLEADSRYLDAVRNPAARPGPWRVAFAAADAGRGSPMRHILLGINAHIAWDIAVVVAPNLRRPADPAQRADYERVNAVIHTIVDDIQEGIRAGGPEWLDSGDGGLGRFDELATWAAFRVIRARALADADALRDGHITLDDLERRTTRQARLLAALPL